MSARPTSSRASRPRSATPEPSAPRARNARIGSLSAGLALALAGAALFLWTWGTWPDVMVDFGREAYAPWQIAQGRALYRDVAWFNGPLSPHVNALAFAIFGASLWTLFLVNAAFLALLTALLYRTLSRASDRLSATVACLVLFGVFGFGQLVGIGNYNWVAPYSHELTHGVLLGIASIAALQRWHGRRHAAWLALSGFCLGLSFLTKAEVFVAALGGTATALGLFLRREPLARRHAGVLAPLFGFSALLPVAGAWALLGARLGPSEALRGVLGSWPWVIGGEVNELAFYRWGAGLDAPLEHLRQMTVATAGWALALLSPLLAAFLARRLRAPSRALALAVFAAEGLALLAVPETAWLHAARPLPLFLLAILAAFAASLWRREVAPRATLGAIELALAVFALLLLGKMGLNARVQHYGFALAMPATLVVTVALVGWIPSLLERRGAHGYLFRAAALALLAVSVARHLQRSAQFIRTKTATVASGADAFRSDPIRGPMVGAALAEIRRRLPEQATLAVLPEGVMLNVLARRANPTPFVNFMPPELAMFGEESILSAFRANPPDFVVLAHKDTSEYGFPLFGREYGRDLYAWVRSNYSPRWQVGYPHAAEPLQPGTLFALQLLERTAGR
ncbi:MAG TPA: glycosyltransferase family 39 protein [Planctomycetota bacterium]|nr:glycosyltransferase family 39 protein [Planctomycetota bacterium]